MTKEPTQLENELNVIGKICDCLKYGSFQGTHAQDVAIGQMYLQGLYNNLSKIVKEAKDKPLESKPEPVVVDSVEASGPK